MMTQKSPKFYCNECHYNTCKKSDYDNHLLTEKHKNSDIISDNFSPKVANFLIVNVEKIINLDRVYSIT